MKPIVTHLLALLVTVSCLYSQDQKKITQLQDFVRKYPGRVSVKWDEVSGGPKRIVAENVFLRSQSVSEKNIAALSAGFIAENGDFLNTGNAQLKFESIVRLGNKYIVTYQQMHDGLPLWNVKCRIKVASNGQVLMIKSPCFDRPSVSSVPKITGAEAKKAAAEYLNVDSSYASVPELVVYPPAVKGDLVLCWHTKVNKTSMSKGLMISAESGVVLQEYDLNCSEEIRGTVEIMTWSLPGQTDGTPDMTTSCQDLYVVVAGGGSTTTNASGFYTISVPSSGSYTVMSDFLSIGNAHCKVHLLGGGSDLHSGTASTNSDHNWTWQNSSYYNQYFVFHYMNKAWHEFDNKVPGFSSNYWHSTNLMEGIANDNFTGGVNGEASGTWLGITPSNHYGCSVYHEYSHNVIYMAHGGWLCFYDPNGDAGAMNEGLPDFYSCSFREDPRRYAVDRRLDGKMKYPGSGSPHIRGQIIGGACWDLSRKDGMSLNYVNDLVYEAIVNIGFDETFGDFMDEILSADDDDGNIFNGTPHDAQICDAFICDHYIMGDPALIYAAIYRYACSNQSTSSQSTGFNGQRKLYREPSGKLHEVFASGAIGGGEIFYRNSSDNGATWNATCALSDGSGTSLAPCITMGTGTNVIVTWQQTNGSNYTVLFRRSSSGGTSWGAITSLQSNFSCASPGPLPSVSANPLTGSVMAVYRSSTGLRFVKSSDNGSSWSSPTGISGTTAAHNGPSTAFYPVASPVADKSNLAFATDVGYSSVIDHGFYSFEGGSWSALSNLSSALPSYYQQQRNPTLAASTNSTTICHVAWEAFNMQQAAAVLVHRKGTSGSFGSQYSVINYQAAANPSISGLAGDNAWIVFQRTQAGALAKVRYSYSGGQWTWGTPENGPAGNYAQLSVGSSSAKYLYTSSTSSPYTVSLGGETLSKTAPLGTEYARELNVIDTKTGSSLTVEVKQPKVVHKDGTISLISFLDAPPDSLTISTRDIFMYGRTQPFVFSLPTDTLKMHYRLGMIQAETILQDPSATLSLNLIDVKTGKAITTIGTRTVGKSSDTTSALYEIAVTGSSIQNLAAGAEVAIELALSGVKKEGPELCASLGHVYTIDSTGAVELSKEVAAENSEPRAYFLDQNYPNPFNPATQIKYSILEDGYVALKVFDVLGREVAVLADGSRRPGVYTSNWNAGNHASGVYLARLTVMDAAGSLKYQGVKKLILAR